LSNLQKYRKDFPILDTGIIYLDNAASSLTPEPVIEKMLEYYRSYRANVERGVHRLSQRASEEFERAHSKVAEFINARSKQEVIATRNTTEGINLVASGLNWKRGDRIVTSILEHHSNFIVWQRARTRNALDLEVARLNSDGTFNIEEFRRKIDDRTRLVAVAGVSNVLGTIAPLREIVEIAHSKGAAVLVDGAQYVPHMKTDVRKLDCDFLAFSGHKMCGPTGIGALYVREELLDQVEPLNIGGGTIEDVSLNSYRLAKSPMRYEAGTPAIAEMIALGRAVDYLKDVGMDRIQEHERRLTEVALQGLAKIPNVEVYGPADPKLRAGIIPFNVGKLNPHDVALALDVSANIMVRSGHHCALPLMKEHLCKREGSARASTYLYNTEEEVLKLVSTTAEIARSLA
jgi:cysteine desulfurase/selenocysteine lyase